MTLSESEPRLAAPADGAPVDAPALPMEEPRAAVAVASRARRRWRNWSSVLAVGWLVLVVLLALLADLLPVEPYDRPVGDARQPPGLHWPEPLGTDALGRSQLSRVVFGARVSVGIGFVAVAAALLVGGTLGVLAGYFRGLVATVIGVLTDSLLAFPALFFLLAITTIYTPSFVLLSSALALVAVPTFIRLARAATLAVGTREYVLAARAMGASSLRVIGREIVPNIVFSLLSYSFLLVAVVIVAEGSLSFLGLGFPPPQPSWGGMIAAGRSELHRHAHLAFVPATPLLLTVLSLNLVGDRARRRFDVRESALR